MKNYWEKGEEYATKVDNIRDDYIATSINKKPKTRKKSSAHLKSSTIDWRTIFCKTSVQNLHLYYYMTDNDLVKFNDHFQIRIVIIKDFKHPKEHFKDGDKCFISDCNLYLTKEKHVFKYCNYFMILGYFDKLQSGVLKSNIFD